MELLEMMEHRRSVRCYTGEPVPQEKMNRIVEAGLLSASSRGRRPWQLYAVTKREILDCLAQCRIGSSKMLENAGGAVVVFGMPQVSDVWIEDCAIVMTQMHLMADHLGLGSCWIQGRLRQAPDGRSTDEYVKEVLGIEKPHTEERRNPGAAEISGQSEKKDLPELSLAAILSVGIADESHRPGPNAVDSDRMGHAHWMQ